MANATSGLGIVHGIVNFTKEKEVMDALWSCISMDNDLTENEDYFQQDTIELGFESEADRKIAEAVKELGLPTDIDGFRNLLIKVTDAISHQEYFCVCDLDIIPVGKNKVSYVFAYGGNYDC